MRSHIDKAFISRLVVIALIGLAVFRFDIIVGAIWSVIDVLTPLTIGCIMAYSINVLMRPIERRLFPRADFKFAKQTRRGVAITLSVLILMAVIALVLWMIIPSLADAPAALMDSFQSLYTDLLGWAEENRDQYPAVYEYLNNFDMNATLELIGGFLSGGDSDGGFVSSAISMIGSIVGIVIDVILGIVFMIYILFNKESLRLQIQRVMHSYVKDSRMNKIYHVINVADECFSSYIIGQCVEALILGGLCTLGMFIFQFPYALMVGSIMTVTALIPIVGAYAGGALGAVMMLTESPAKAILFVVFIVVLQQIEGNVIYPRVVGNSIGLPGIWVLAAITIGGGVGGIIGMLFGVPIFATCYKLISEHVHKREERDKRAGGTVAAVSPQEEEPAEPTASEQTPPAKSAVQEEPETAAHSLFSHLFHHSAPAPQVKKEESPKPAQKLEKEEEQVSSSLKTESTISQ